MGKKVKPLSTPIQKGPLEAKELGAFVRARRTQAGMGIHEAAAFCGDHEAVAFLGDNAGRQVARSGGGSPGPQD